LLGWAAAAAGRVEPRLALQLVHEAALCTTGVRAKRALTMPGLALVNGLPFLAADLAIHELLGAHTVAQAQGLQRALGLLRRAAGDYAGRVLIVDPHRVRSYSKRRMARRKEGRRGEALKVHQSFFALDADTRQPVCFTTATASRTAATATPELLDLAASILGPRPAPTLVLADAEHASAELIDRAHQATGFDLLVPLAMHAALRQQLKALPEERFTRHWAGFATAQIPYRLASSTAGPFWLLVQRLGERQGHFQWKAFLCTARRDELLALTQEYPKRWHVEEFFNTDQALGWNRAGTQNLNIRYGHMTMALVAQAVLHRLRQRLGAPVAGWNAGHLAQALLRGLEGDVRVSGRTITVTYYNAPQAEQLRGHYEGLPQKLRAEDVNPAIPWRYGYQLDFRFR
jgi:hypothetical protein